VEKTVGLYAEYLDRNFDMAELNAERKTQLKRISELRNRPILVYASSLSKQAPISIIYDDRLPFFDQLSGISGDSIDLILETPGGQAEVVEDLVETIRSRFSSLGIIVPGWAKSAGTIMVMAADEILMEPSSALGPIDAQIVQNGKQYSAHAFLQGLEKIKEEVRNTGLLNKAYIPILQNISPGEIQGCENALSFSQKLVREWLCAYKFKFWETHSTNGAPVTVKEKEQRAKEVASILCDHSNWLTHGRSITLSDLTGPEIRLVVTDYSKNYELCDAIRRYYTLLKMTFESTNIYKVFETPTSQIYNFAVPPGTQIPQGGDIEFVHVDVVCPNCKAVTKIQANMKPGIPMQGGAFPFPANDVLICPTCKSSINIGDLRKNIESQTKKHIY